MDFGLSDDQREIQRTARSLLSERSTFERVRTLAGTPHDRGQAGERAEARRPDSDLWRELCDLGWPGIAIPERYGGQGLGLVELSILCEELGRAVAPVPFLPSVMAAAVIERAGSELQCERLLPALASGGHGAAVGVASDGRAEFVVGGGRSDIDGISDRPANTIVLLEGDGARVLGAEEAEVTLVPAIDPTRSAATVSAPAGAGERLEGDVAAGLHRALVAVSSELVGVCGRALEMTVAYVKERRQFGVPVGSYQAVSHRCAQMLLDTERARSSTAFAAWAADAGSERLPEAAAMAKAAASEAAVEVTASAIQAHGGIGFTWEADVHWLYKRALVDAALLGGVKQQRARLAALL